MITQVEYLSEYLETNYDVAYLKTLISFFV